MTHRLPGPIPLEIENLELWFPSGQSPALVDVNVRLMPGTVTAIIGPAGIGKSTLFKAILNEIAISSGSVKVHGEKIENGEAVNPDHFSYVPQKTHLMDKLTVWQTIELAVYARLPKAKSRKERDEVVTDVLHKLSMSHKKDGLIKDLSGGEERRVSIALELVSNPHLLLLDEPTSGLDEGLDKELHETLRNVADDERKPAVLFVTHSTRHLDLVDPTTNRPYVDQVIAIGRATDKSNTATVRHQGRPNQILADFGVESYSEVMDILRAAPAQPVHIPTEKPALNFKRSHKTLSWYRSFVYNLQRQWLLIGRTKGLLKSIQRTVLLGSAVAVVLWGISRLGLGLNLEGPNQEFLTYTSMLVLLLAFGGTLLPIMGIVMSWDVMRREQRWGVSARSFIWAQMVIQILMLVPAVAAATIISLMLTSGPTDVTLLPQTQFLSSYWHLFVLLLPPTLVSYCIGVLIGCLNTSSNKANYASGFVFAVMLVGNGLIFTWNDFWAIYYPSFLIPSRTGIAMIASNFNAEMVMGGTRDAAFRMSAEQLYLAMAVMAGLGVVFLIISMFAVKYPLKSTGHGTTEAVSTGGTFSTPRVQLPAAVVLAAIVVSSTMIYISRSTEGEVFGGEEFTQQPVTNAVAQPQSQSQQPNDFSAVVPTPTAIQPQSFDRVETNVNRNNASQDTYVASTSGQEPQARVTETPQQDEPEQPADVAMVVAPDDAEDVASEPEQPADVALQDATDDAVGGTDDANLTAQTSQSTVDDAVETDQPADVATGDAPVDAVGGTDDAGLSAQVSQSTDDDAAFDEPASALEVETDQLEAVAMEDDPDDATNGTGAPSLQSEDSASTDVQTTSLTVNPVYFDIGNVEAEPEIRHFGDVIETESNALSCDLGGYQDWTKRPQQAQADGEFSVITVGVSSHQQTTISICIEEEESTDDWTIWLGLNAPAEFDCDSINLPKPGDLDAGINIVTWTIPAECVHLNEMMLVFSGTSSGGAAIWGVLVEQDPNITAEPPSAGAP